MKVGVKQLYPYIFLALVAIIAYWPMSLMIYSAKNDAIHYFLAMRYNTSEMIQHGIFPGWSPYINLGYPLHGDIQSGAWNPFVLLMSLVRQYDIYWLHTEIILINIMAGVGMFRLLRYLRIEQKISLAVAVAYMLNGYMSDAGQFLNWLYAGALLPFVFLFALRATNGFHWKDAVGLGFFYALLLLCGYPADTILSFYLLLAWFIYSFIRWARHAQFTTSLKKHSAVLFISALSFFLICLPALVSFAEFFPLVRRGGGVDWETASSNSLAPANLVSFIYPWLTLKGQAFAETDPLIRNCYFGVLALTSLAAAFLRNENHRSLQRFLFWAALVFLVFALGKFGGLRWISFQFLPLMDTFRHPANAKLFFLFAAQILAAFSLDKIFRQQPPDRRFIRLGWVLAVTSLLLLFAGLIKGGLLNMAGNISKLKEARDHLATWDLLALNAGFLFLFLAVSLKILNKRWKSSTFLFLVCLEMILIAQLMIPLTYVRNYPAVKVQEILRSQPRGYPIPNLQTSIAENSQGAMRFFEDIGCINPYNKEIGRANYIISPSNLASQESFWEDSVIRDRILNRPLIYFADTVFAWKDRSSFLQYAGNRSAIRSWNERGNVEGTAGSPGGIRIGQFSPQRVKLETENAGTGHLVFMQNFYPRWRAFANGKELFVGKMNESFMTVTLLPGRNEVVFDYKIKDLQIMSAISLTALLAAFCILVTRKRTQT